MSGRRQLMIAQASIDPLTIPLTLEARQANSTVRIVFPGGKSTMPTDDLYYRTSQNSGWTQYPYDADTASYATITLRQVGDKVQFMCTSSYFSKSTDSTAYRVFRFTGMVYAYGNLHSLFDCRRDVPYSCFRSLFQSQTRLFGTKIIIPSAVILARYAYVNMFYGCSNVNRIEVNLTEWPSDNGLADWVRGVSATGTFYKPKELPTEFGNNRIPTGWTVVDK